DCTIDRARELRGYALYGPDAYLRVPHSAFRRPGPGHSDGSDRRGRADCRVAAGIADRSERIHDLDSIVRCRIRGLARDLRRVTTYGAFLPDAFHCGIRGDAAGRRVEHQ